MNRGNMKVTVAKRLRKRRQRGSRGFRPQFHEECNEDLLQETRLVWHIVVVRFIEYVTRRKIESSVSDVFSARTISFQILRKIIFSLGDSNFASLLRPIVSV